MNLRLFVLLIFYSLFFTPCFTQNQVEFRQLIGGNVPTQSITYAVVHDSIGNIWVASEEGVLKHNSKYYKIYNSYNGLPLQIGNRINEIFVDSKNRIWVGSEKGICIYNPDLDKFEYVTSKRNLNPSLVKVIIEDRNNTIWVGGFNGLWKFDELTNSMDRVINNHNIQALDFFNNKLVFGTPKGAFSYNYLDNTIGPIAINSNNKNIWLVANLEENLLVATKTGSLYEVEKDLSKATLIDIGHDFSNAITDIIKTSDKSYLLATDGSGVFELDSNFKKTRQFIENPNELYSISSNGIYDIELGKEGVLWIATYGGGLNYLNSSELPFQNIRHKINDANSIVANFTRAIEQDKNGNIWFGTKKGISILNIKNNSWRHINTLISDDNKTDVIVLALQQDDDFMWVGTYNQGLYKINVNSLASNKYNTTSSEFLEKVYAIYKDSKGNIWAGGIERDMVVISPNSTFKTYPIQQVKSISETASGEIIISGRQGVFMVNNDTETFGLIENLTPNKADLAFATINSAYENDQGDLILATNGEGLILYDVDKREIKKLKRKSGMPSDIIQGAISVNGDNIWASTTKGLVNIKFNSKDTIFDVYDKKDGLASTEYNYGSFKKINDSLFAFGGVEGVTMFNPYKIKAQSHKPRLVFDSFKLSNKIIEPGDGPLKNHINRTDNIVLGHSDNSIEIQYTGVLHSASSKVKYSWILEGFDEGWSVPSNTNFATYTNLNPGNYIFKVKANNKYGVFSDERQIKIKIESPWWATNKAYFLYALLLIGLLYAVIHFTSVMVKKKNADEQIDFFNNITHEIKTPLTILISSLDNVTEDIGGENDSKKRIKTTVKRINALFEQMLNFQKVTSADNLNLDISELDVYALIQQRIHNFEPLTKERNIDIVFNNDWNESLYYDKDSFDKIMLNLISNAIKYSLDNGTITINTSKNQKGNLQIEVIDKGIGIPKDQQKYILKRYFRARNVINSQRAGTGLGLMMVKKILEKTNGSISFVSAENKGTAFTITIKNLKEEFNHNNSKTKESLVRNIGEDIQEQTELTEFSDSKILIVEDNNELRGLLSNNLGNYFQIYEAKNGKEGLEMASTIFPDLILTDLIMPEMDGMQMSKELKSDISLNHIPVFMLTVLQNSEQKLESIETGISEYIEKPIDIKYLLAKITNTLKWQQKLRQKYVHDSDADSAEIFRNKNDQEFLTNLENTVIENLENNNFSVHDLSSSFGMSRTSLYMKLKNLVDLSPQDFIIHTRLKYAKSLLIKGNFSIKEVAYQSGFSNPKYFSTSFKKFYGMTPSGFTESLKK